MSGSRGLRGLAGLFGLLGLLGCDAEPSEQGPPPARGLGARMGPAVDVGIQAWERERAEEAMLGVVVPAAEVLLVSNNFARVEVLDLKVGDHVGLGQLVAQMDIRGDQSEFDQATAAWKASKAELERLELELEQAKSSRAEVESIEDFVSKAELRERRYAEKVAEARRRVAGASAREQRTKMSEAEARMAEAQLRAPFEGSVSQRYVDEGATVGMGDPVLELISDERLVRFAVPESRSSLLQLGAIVEMTIENVGGVPTVVRGRVDSIAPQVDPGTRLIFVEARLGLHHPRPRTQPLERLDDLLDEGETGAEAEAEPEPSPEPVTPAPSQPRVGSRVEVRFVVEHRPGTTVAVDTEPGESAANEAGAGMDPSVDSIAPPSSAGADADGRSEPAQTGEER